MSSSEAIARTNTFPKAGGYLKMEEEDVEEEGGGSHKEVGVRPMLCAALISCVEATGGGTRRNTLGRGV